MIINGIKHTCSVSLKISDADVSALDKIFKRLEMSIKKDKQVYKKSSKPWYRRERY